MTVLGLDIGGANIKAANAEGWACSLPFPLWKQPEQLTARLQRLLAEAPACERVAVTMTGELADCFATRAEGVRRIIVAVMEAVADRPVVVWTTSGRFLPPAAAIESVLAVSAANWHALATWLARQWPRESGLLVDIGSTTTDIIPFRQGEVCARGSTDFSRLQNQELVYTGVRRTPLCAVSSHIQVRGYSTPVAAEWFATTVDIHLWRGLLTEDPDDRDTADGRPCLKSAAAARLARMVCSDEGELNPGDVDEIAAEFAAAQLSQIRTAVESVLARQEQVPDRLIVSGSGEFLARQVAGQLPQLATVPRSSMSDLWGSEVATSACAFAVACLS